MTGLAKKTPYFWEVPAVFPPCLEWAASAQKGFGGFPKPFAYPD